MTTTVEPGTEHGPELPARPEAARETLACPTCGTPTDRGQLMCLECGSRLALDYRRHPSWRLPAAVVGLVLLLAGAGVAFALAQVTRDASRTSAVAPTQPVPAGAPADTPPTPAQPTPAQPTPTTPATGTTPATTGGTPATPTTTTPPAAAQGAGWPAGKSAFTVILASLPDQAAADKKLKEAQAAGIAGASILHSDDFPTLRPGYWVVFDGQYATIGQATQQASQDKGKGGFSDAYPRFVSKDQNAKP